MGTVKKALLIIAAAVAIWYLASQAVEPEHLVLTVNVPLETEPGELAAVLDTIEGVNATATVFVPGAWAENHTGILERIRRGHELGCYTQTESRLARLKGENLSREVLGCKESLGDVKGFRAPANDLGGESFALVAEHYEYDSSLYHRYGWFWEEPPDGLAEVPVSSVLVMPLDDAFGLRVFRMGEFFFTLARRAQHDPVVVSVTAPLAAEHLLELEFMIRHFQEDGTVPVTMEELVASWRSE